MKSESFLPLFVALSLLGSATLGVAQESDKKKPDEKPAAGEAAKKDGEKKKAKKIKIAEGKSVSLIDPKKKEHWTKVDIAANAGFEIDKEGALSFGIGEPLSAARYEGPVELPLKDYEITFKAQRIDGTDFFAGVTFPVRDIKDSCTFVVGGWGGNLVGISSIDHQDAANNETASVQVFEDKKWYDFRIEVRDFVIKAWMEKKIIVNVIITDRKIGMRFGDIEETAPFGLSSFMTKSAIKDLKIKKLKPRKPSEDEQF